MITPFDALSSSEPGAGGAGAAREDAALLRRNWGWVAFRGVLALALAVIALLFPVSALFAFTLVFAAYAGADGILSIVAGIRGARLHRERWWTLALRGAIGIAVLVLFLAMPGLATVGYAIATLAVLATWAILAGVLELMAAVRLRREIEGEWLLGLSGALSILLGLAIPVVLFVDPLATIVSVGWVIALYALVAGVALVRQGLRLRSARA